ncbi:MAG TPA: DNA polymerase III subunit beta [Alloiococcus sp.]|nr:DNA polymerase III subunit beta [Alloiococcus sp.]
MKFTVKRTEFLKKLKDVQIAVSSKTTIPILTGIKLEAYSSGIKLTGSNSDISIETFLNADDTNADLTIEEKGQIVLQPARLFGDIVQKLPDTHFSVEVTNGNQALITSSSSSFTINGIDAANYPHLPDIELDNSFLLPVTLFKNVIRQTVIAVSTHETRPILTGVNLSLKDQTLKAVATDSHRLSQRVIPLETNKETTFNIVIPGKSLTELSRLLTDDMDEVRVAIAENQILFKTEDTQFYSRLLEGNYPETERLIPEDTPTEITLDTSTLLGAVERASLLSHEGKNNVVKLTVDSNKMQITGNSPEVGHVQEDVAFEEFKGDEIEISFNPDYLKQALNTFGVGEIKLKLISTLRPFVIVPSEDNQEFIQLITPIRTS